MLTKTSKYTSILMYTYIIYNQFATIIGQGAAVHDVNLMLKPLEDNTEK